jgi:ribosomal protein L19
MSKIINALNEKIIIESPNYAMFRKVRIGDELNLECIIPSYQKNNPTKSKRLSGIVVGKTHKGVMSSIRLLKPSAHASDRISRTFVVSAPLVTFMSINPSKNNKKRMHKSKLYFLETLNRTAASLRKFYLSR